MAGAIRNGGLAVELVWIFWGWLVLASTMLSLWLHNAIALEILPCAGSFLLHFYWKRLYWKNTKGGTFVINSLKILWKPAMALITKTLQDATSCKVFYLINLQHHAKVENCKQVLSDTKHIAQWSKDLLESQRLVLILAKQTRGLGFCSW